MKRPLRSDATSEHLPCQWRLFLEPIPENSALPKKAPMIGELDRFAIGTEGSFFREKRLKTVYFTIYLAPLYP
jgi:hypothetical protein